MKGSVSLILFSVCLLPVYRKAINFCVLMRFHLASVRVPKSNKINDSRCWGGCGKIFTKSLLYSLLMGVQTGVATMEISEEFSQKLNMDVPQDPSVTPLSIYSEDSISYYRDTCSSMFIAILSIIARNEK